MDTHTNSYDLSEREFQIMELVSIGKFNKEIADKLNIKPDTIAKHLQHIFYKMEFKPVLKQLGNFWK